MSTTADKQAAVEAQPPPRAAHDGAARPRPERTASFRDYLRVFSYATKWDFAAYAAGALASMGAGVTLPLMNVVFGNLVGSFSDFDPGAGADADKLRRKLGQLSLYIFALFLGRFGLNYINKLCFRMIGIRLSAAVRLHYLRRLLRQSVHVLDSMPPGHATNTITSTSNTLQLGISEHLGVLIEYSSTLVAALVVAFYYNWLLTLVTFSAIVFILLVESLLLPWLVRIQGRVAKSETKAAAVASETMSGIRMVMACGAEARIAHKYAKLVDETKKHARLSSPLLAAQFAVIFFSIFAAFGLAFWYGTKAYLDGRLKSVATIIIVLFSVMVTVFCMERISNPLLAIGKATVAACQFFIVIDSPQPDNGHFKAPDVSATEDIVFEKVVFAYPSRPHIKVLDELDLRIEAGKITAIVGPSGSGKSTIVGLIERWYSLKEQYVMARAVEQKKKKKRKGRSSKIEDNAADDDDDDDDDDPAAAAEPEEAGPPVKLSGSISTSGHSLDEINLSWWRSQIGLVQQDPFLFDDTIYANVANGLVGSPWEHEPEDTKRELVREACKESFADEFIDKLPNGYDTAVGDGGAKLSGGQRQRIAIARSIVRKPKILILDEATSAIDVRAERIVQAALDRVAQNRTTIAIAHRLSTIKKADRIIVLHHGRVVESGTHQGLMAHTGGLYAGLVGAQALALGGAAAEASDDDNDDSSSASLSRFPAQRRTSRDGSASASAAEPTTPAVDGKQTQTRRRNVFTSFGLFFYESRQLWWLMCLTLLFAAGAGAAIPLQAWLFGQVVVVFQNTGARLRSQSEFWSLMWLVLAGGVGLAYFGCFLASTQMAATVRAKYQKQYFEAMLHQKSCLFDDEDHSSGVMAARAAGDPQQLEELMGANMASVYIALFALAGSVAIAFAFGWKLALVACCVVVPVSTAATYWRFRYEFEFERMNNAVFAESSKFASESIGAFRTVAALTLEDAICQRFETLCRAHVAAAFNKARWVSLLFAFSDSAGMACQALVFYYGGQLLVSGEYRLLNFLVCSMTALQSGEAMGQSLSFGPNAAKVTAASNRILDLRETQLSDDASGKGAISSFRSRGGIKIELDDLHFAYPTRDVPVFQGLSLTVEKGQFAALVGASGCGKTSIISLLERFYDLDGGRILCNGEDIARINLYAYRKHLSLVAQEATLFQGTIRENILLGVDEASVSEEQLHQACRDASIHDFIVSLPDGYGTNIGSRGIMLSGGQKQRVAIARALVRDPDVLLLDEATSSLDSESEKLVQAAFERAGQGRTMLVVAHRLATIQNADVIFVLSEGRLLEKGNHADLLRQKGVYWQMCQSQALDR